jgi:hypothetical protein
VADLIYCTTAERFRTYLQTPPLIALLTKSLTGGVRAGVRVSLSKLATVTLRVRRDGRVVWTNTATVEAGKPRLLWVTPARGGSYSITLSATDMAGNFATAMGTIAVAATGAGHRA